MTRLPESISTEIRLKRMNLRRDAGDWIRGAVLA